jgi:hypothetical protein
VQVLGASAAAPAPAAGSRGSGSQPPLGIPVLRDGGVLMAVRCTGAEGAPCAVYVDVRALPRRSRGGRSKTTSVARLRTTIPNGRTVLLRAPLSRAGARLVRRSGRVRAVASVLLRPQGGPPRRWSRPLHLVRRGL